MSKARWGRTALEPAPVLPKVRWGRSGLEGTHVLAPKVRWARVAVEGTAAVIVSPLAAQAVEPESVVTVAAALSTTGPADSWTFRRVSGPTIGIQGSGATRTFIAPSQDAPTNPAVPPQSSTVVIGVTATKDGTTSAERTCTVTIMPQTQWVWNGTKLVGTRTIAL